MGFRVELDSHIHTGNDLLIEMFPWDLHLGFSFVSLFYFGLGGVEVLRQGLLGPG